MNNSDQVVLLTARATHSAIRDRLSGLSTEDKLRAIWREIFNPAGSGWMCRCDDEWFRSGVGAALLDAGDDERARIEAALAPIRALSAAMTGVPVDWEHVLPATSEAINALVPLMPLYNEIKKEFRK